MSLHSVDAKHLSLVPDPQNNTLEVSASRSPVSKPTAILGEFLSAHVALMTSVPDAERTSLAAKARRFGDAYHALMRVFPDCPCWASGGAYCVDCQALADGKERA